MLRVVYGGKNFCNVQLKIVINKKKRKMPIIHFEKTTEGVDAMTRENY
jgi:hypothetical protein